ncbi:NAD-dependent epimerase/dehydratase family protein [Streptomyces sp. NPDC014793]|uniref:NAD-dependent epimerase/dehydratase family protein n=1 Tax=Streptomyces sp. NPDC014793 TaxID=3364914 RepID=UPI0036F7EAC6
MTRSNVPLTVEGRHRIVDQPLTTDRARPIALCTQDADAQRNYRDLFGIAASDPGVIVGDIQNTALVKKTDADYVIHAAALADVAACTREPMSAIHNNITSTQVPLDTVAACARIRRPMYVSSASVYGNGNPDGWARPCDEYWTVRALLEFVYGRVPPHFHEHAPLRPMSV